jgi:predicted nucleic acid-binding protein
MNDAPGLAVVRGFTHRFTDRASATPLLFVDANALIALQEHALSKDRRFPKHDGLAAFVAHAVSQGSEVITTPAAVEEVAHVLSRRLLRNAQRIRSCVDPKELRRKYPEDFVAAQAKGTRAAKQTIDVSRNHNISIWAPIGTTPEDARALGAKTVDMFFALSIRAPYLGAQDAMHIVTCALLECREFVSNDGDFRFAPGVVVYCERPNADVR